MKWNILVIRGKKNDKYFVSTGEGKWKKVKKNKKIKLKDSCSVMPKRVIDLYSFIIKFIF